MIAPPSGLGAGPGRNWRTVHHQVDFSVRPATIQYIERDLREFQTYWQAHAEVASCADLERKGRSPEQPLRGPTVHLVEDH
jgi:hypothetical protein